VNIDTIFNTIFDGIAIEINSIDMTININYPNFWSFSSPGVTVLISSYFHYRLQRIFDDVDHLSTILYLALRLGSLQSGIYSFRTFLNIVGWYTP
jgi:hypothetical protein